MLSFMFAFHNLGWQLSILCKNKGLCKVSYTDTSLSPNWCGVGKEIVLTFYTKK